MQCLSGEPEDKSFIDKTASSPDDYRSWFIDRLYEMFPNTRDVRPRQQDTHTHSQTSSQNQNWATRSDIFTNNPDLTSLR